MPRRKFFMRRRASSHDLTQWVVGGLFGGPTHHNESRMDFSHARTIWERHEDTLMRWWFGGFPADFYVNPFLAIDIGLDDSFPQPGRPWAWWQFSAPRPRRLLSVYKDGRQLPATSDLEREAYDAGLGRSRETYERANGAGYSFESDLEFLTREKLLTNREKESAAR